MNAVLSFFVAAMTLIGSVLGIPSTGFIFDIDCPAAVFESGDNMYTVMWTTTKKGSGYITYSYQGKEYTVTDHVGGDIRTDDTIHSVRVPKEHLDHNTYIYHSESVPFKFGYLAFKGRTVSSEPVEFGGYSEGETIRFLTLSDIHENLKPVLKAVSHFEEKPSMIILNGDIVSSMEYKSSFVKIISYAAELSEGKIPVAYVRGNHEPRGEFAANILKYFRTTTGGIYYTFNYGPAWALVGDSGEDKDDDHKEYSGLVDFTAYIAQESEWLNSLVPDTADGNLYRICFVHQPYLNPYGNDWIAPLSEKGIQAVVSGHTHSLVLDYQPGSAPFHRIIDGGKNDECSYIATMLTFDGGNMNLKSIQADGTVAGEKTYEMI